MEFAKIEIFSNKAKCVVCGQLLDSTDDTEVVCHCGQLTISGGYKELKRKGDFVEMSMVQRPSGLPDIEEKYYEQNKL